MTATRFLRGRMATVSLATMTLLTTVGSICPTTAGAADPVQVIEIQPRAIVVTAGSVVAFQRYSPSSLVTGVQWSASGGTISSTGVFTAPATPGSYVIQAMVGGIASTATVLVVSSGSPASIHAAAASSCAAMPIRSTGTKYYFCDCQAGAQSGCVAGSDSNAGTNAAAPKQSFAAARTLFNSMPTGSTIAFCRGGSWLAAGGVVFRNSNCSGSADPRAPANTTTCDVRDYSPTWGGTERPIIKGTGGNLFEFNNVASAGTRILNLNLTGPGSAYAVWLYGKHDDFFFCNNVIQNWNWAFDVQNASTGKSARVHVVGNRILNNSGEGYWGGGDDSSIDANYFENNGALNNRDHTLYLSNRSPFRGPGGPELFGDEQRDAVHGRLLPGSRAHRTRTVQRPQHREQHHRRRSHQWPRMLRDLGRERRLSWRAGMVQGSRDQAKPRAEWRQPRDLRRGGAERRHREQRDCSQGHGLSPRDRDPQSRRPDQPGRAGHDERRHPEQHDLSTPGQPFTVGASRSASTPRWDTAFNEGTGYIVANNTIFNTNAGYSCFETPIQASRFAFVGNNACYNGPWTTTYDATTHVTANPLYTSAPTDFSPQAGSPLNGAGNSAQAPPNDMNLKSRPNPPSIGAIER